jgi:hypothetical protein
MKSTTSSTIQCLLLLSLLLVGELLIGVLAQTKSPTLKPSFAPIAGTRAPTVPAPPTFGSPTSSPTGVPHNITIQHYTKTVKCAGTPFKTEIYQTSQLSDSVCQFYVPPGSSVKVWKGYCSSQQIVGDSGGFRPVLNLKFYFKSATCPPSSANGAEVPKSVATVAGTTNCYTDIFPTSDVVITHDCTIQESSAYNSVIISSMVAGLVGLLTISIMMG